MDYLKRLDEYILRPLFIHKYDKGTLQKMEIFYNMFAQNASKLGSQKSDVEPDSPHSDKSKNKKLMRKLNRGS